MTADLPHRVTIPPRVLVEFLDGEAVALNLDSEKYYGLDDVGSRMWQLLAESGDPQTAAAQLEHEYQVEPEQLRADLAEFIAKLAGLGLLTIEI